METQILKSFTVEQVHSDKQRTFKCWGSVEVKDRAGEIIEADEVYKVMDIWMDRGAPIMFNHTNRNVGRGLNWQPLKKNGKPGVLITAKIYDHYTEDDEIWNGIKKGDFEGLSIGGKNFEEEETKEGTFLRNLIGYEFSVVERCGNPEATFEEINMLAKSELPDDAIPVGSKKVPEGYKTITGPRGGKYMIPEGEDDEGDSKEEEVENAKFDTAEKLRANLNDYAKDPENKNELDKKKIQEDLKEQMNNPPEFDSEEAEDAHFQMVTDLMFEIFSGDYATGEGSEKDNTSVDREKYYERLSDIMQNTGKSSSKMAKQQEKKLKKEDEVVTDDQESQKQEEGEQDFQSKAMALFEKINERLDAIEETISGSGSDEEEVEEQKGYDEEEESEETEKKTEKKESKESKTEKSEGEDKEKDDLKKSLDEIKKEITNLKKSQVKEVSKTDRPDQPSQEVNQGQDFMKNIDDKIEEMKKSGNFNFKELGAEIRKAKEDNLKQKLGQ